MSLHLQYPSVSLEANWEGRNPLPGDGMTMVMLKCLKDTPTKERQYSAGATYAMEAQKARSLVREYEGCFKYHTWQDTPRNDRSIDASCIRHG